MSFSRARGKRWLRRSPVALAAALGALGALAALVPAVAGAQASDPQVFINEFHYDNAGTDAGEFVEIAGPAGTDLSGYSLVLYNGDPSARTSYRTDPLSGTIPDQQNGFGTAVVDYPTNGIQNGGPDGIALVQGSTVIQFLSYEGSFTAANGPAAGVATPTSGGRRPGPSPAVSPSS